MHILFLTDNFPPEVNAPASRTFEHCREWARAGHQVTVITCAPNFPKGKVFAGYRNRLFARERMDGIDVVRVWSYITANEGFLRRTIDYMSFMFAATPASLRVPKPDVVVATSPQFFTACAGYLVSRLRRAPFVFELRDLWPESIRAVGAMRSSPLLDALERLELFLYRRAAHVVSVTHAFKQDLVKRGIPGDKISVTTNGVDLSRFSPTPRDDLLASKLGLTGKIVVGYVGTHGMAHALDTLLKAAQILKRESAVREVRFLFLGDGAQKAALKAMAAELDLDTVQFIDSVPRSEVVRYWSLVDIAVIHLKRTELFETVIPSKLFECMAMGVPVLHGVAGESADIVVREQCGVPFEPENADELAARIVELCADPARRGELAQQGRKAAPRYARSSLAAEMLETLRCVHERRAVICASDRGISPE